MSCRYYLAYLNSLRQIWVRALGTEILTRDAPGRSGGRPSGFLLKVFTELARAAHSAREGEWRTEQSGLPEFGWPIAIGR